MRYADAHCVYKEEFAPNHVYIFTGHCIVTGQLYSVEVPADELYAYRQGAYIQDALRSVSREDREFLISGTSPEGWAEMFGSPEED